MISGASVEQMESIATQIVGPKPLTFSVGDICVSVINEEPDLNCQATGAARQFLVHDGHPDASVHVRWGGFSENGAEQRVFDSGALWQLYRCGDRHIFRFSTPALGTLPYKEARFDRDFVHGEVSLRRETLATRQPVDPLEYPLDELVMVNLLSQGRGVEVHACGLRDGDGHGYLFLGQSGAGKTTTARLWQQDETVEVLSDDRIILRQMEGRIWMYGTPWHGEAELAAATRTPLTGVFFLRQAPRNEIVPLRPADAVARFLVCSFIPFYSRGGLDFSVGFFESVAESVPCSELSFLPDRTMIDAVRQQVEGRL
jgi:hypothetical protein